MTVRRDFEEIYRTEDDPWAIGEADSERYELYRRLILDAAGRRGSMLDIGCGLGAFLARFEGEFERLVGVELSELAVAKGRRRFPAVRFVQGSAARLDAEALPGGEFDAIVLSDVLYYLDEPGRRRSLRWVADHLADGGIAFVAGWCPGGAYLTPDELRSLVDRYLAVDSMQVLDSEHGVLLCRPRRRLVALTVDYETWQPIPEGRSIDWDRDVFEPTARLLDACDREGARLTLMAEMGEHAWLRENEPALAERMEEQWREAVRRGHDVQLHLHPTWLPELGARREPDGGWRWDWSRATANEYPGDLGELFGRLKRTLEDAIRSVDDSYRVTSFRAGAYEAQPFDRLYDSLSSNGIGCDSSVYAGGRHPDRGYDYRLAYSAHDPYFASRRDPQLKAPPAEREVVEIPVLAPAPGERWTFDGPDGDRFARRLLEVCSDAPPRIDRVPWRRLAERARGRMTMAYGMAARARGLVNRALPRSVARLVTPYAPERLVDDSYFVLVGHTKSDLDVDAIARGIRDLREDGRFTFVTLSEMAARARADLEGSQSRDRRDEAARQVRREYDIVLGRERNERPSFLLQERIPLDRRRVLDLGCGAGDWSARIARLMPWVEVVGVDVGEDFVAAASERNGSERVSFELQDFAEMSLPDGSFDCVYADNSLEHAFDVDRTLGEVHRVLSDRGMLVAALPSDARNPRRITDNHTWKTAPHELRMRLESAGFADVSVEEVDLYRALGQPPYPPSDDRMMYVTAWKRPRSALERVDGLCEWAYRALDPERAQESDDPCAILAGGHAWCWGYALVLGEALRREGFAVRWITMVAGDHPRGRGPEREDSHEVVEVELPGGERHVVDAMANVRFARAVRELLRDPGLADSPAAGGGGDERWGERSYDLYATSFWYSRVRRVAVRRRPADPLVWSEDQRDPLPPSPARVALERARALPARLGLGRA